MKDKNRFPRIGVLELVAHILFISGAVLLFIYADASSKPIHIEQSSLYKIILIYSAGYVVVFTKWLGLLKCNDPYIGSADDVPGYLTDMLWGSFPYLLTLGKSNRGNQRSSIKSAHFYQDSDVRGRKFREIFTLHVNEKVIFISLLICASLPYMFLNQTAPSYLKFIYGSSILFTFYISIFVIVWLGSIAIITLRVLLIAKDKMKSD